MPPKKSALLTLILVVAIVIFTTVCSNIGVTNGWMACLFLWYWSSVKGFDPKSIKNIFVGGLVGTLCVGALYFILHTYGAGPFHIVEPVVLFAVIFLCVWDPLPLFFNGATFLYFTVLTAVKFLVGGSDYVEIIGVFVVGTVYFGGILTVLLKMLTKEEQGAEV